MLNKYNFPGKLPDDPEWYWEEMEEEPKETVEEETTEVSLKDLALIVDKINERAMSLVNMLYQYGQIDKETFQYYSNIFKGR